MNILLNLDGVLSSESGEPIRAGVLLYYALNANHRVSIITKRTKVDADHWLNSHGIIKYDDVLDNSCKLEGEDLKKRQVLLSRNKAPVELYVDADPEMCAWVFEKQGIPVILFSDPSFLPIEWRPDAPKQVRSWNEIEESINKINIARSKEAQQAKPWEQSLWQD